MIRKSFVGRILVVGLAVGIAMPALGILGQNQSAEPNPDLHKVIAYYFHTNTR